MAPAPARKPVGETAQATQPGEVQPTPAEPTPATQVEDDQAANQERARDVNPDTTSVSLLTDQQAHPERTFHDSLSGRPVNEQGYFTDGQGLADQGPIPQHRIVANDWAERQQANVQPQPEANNTDA
jgi:hypothetical protein